MQFSLKLGLRRKLMLLMLGLLVLSLGAVWRVATTMARESLVQLTHDTSAVSAQSLANAIDLQIEDARADASVTARLDLVAETIDSGDPKTFVWYADELMRAKVRYAALWVIDNSGKIIAANSRRQGDESSPYIGRSVAQEAWFVKAMAGASNQSRIIDASRPVLLQHGLAPQEFVFGFAFPVVDVVGERTGTLAIFMWSRALDDMLKPSLEGSGDAIAAFAALVDAQGNLVTMPAAARDANVWHDVEHYTHFEVPLEGAAKMWGWHVAALRSNELLDRPVDALSKRLQGVFGITLLVASLASVLMASALLRPIYRLIIAATRASESNTFDAIPIQSTDETAQLTTAFNAMMLAIKEREGKLESARRELHDLFNKIPSAIFVVNREARIDPQYSAYCQNVFELPSIAGMHVEKLLNLASRTDEEAASRMLFWLNNVFGADDLQWDMSAPDRMSEIIFTPNAGMQQKILEMAYVPVYENGVIDKIMFIARDVTELRGLAKRALDAEAMSRETLQRVQSIARLDPSLFRVFMQETQILLERLGALQTTLRHEENSSAVLLEMGRILHTLKGNARMFKLARIQSAAHRSEDHCVALIGQARPAQSDIDGLIKSLGEVETLVAEFYDLGRELLQGLGSSDADGSMRVRVHQLRCLEDAVQALHTALMLDVSKVSDRVQERLGDLERATRDLRYIPLADHLAPLQEMTGDLARQLNKPVRKLEIVGGEVALDARRVPRLLEILGHAVRNAIDHGLESAEERIAAGKSIDGTVRLKCERTISKLTLEVDDDGRGVDVDAVKDALIRKKLMAASQTRSMQDAEVMQALFLPGFTTADKVTDVSGRGIGLDAVSHMVRSLGGSVGLSSERGKGTKLWIELPL